MAAEKAGNGALVLSSCTITVFPLLFESSAKQLSAITQSCSAADQGVITTITEKHLPEACLVHNPFIIECTEDLSKNV
jgi:hypothetical protein